MDSLSDLLPQARSLPSLPLYQWLLVFLALYLTGKTFLQSTKGNMPPGPRGLPFLGNIFQVSKFQWLRFTEWKDEFGPIFSLNMAGIPVVVLNTHEAVADLFDRRSTNYSDRPRLIVAGEYLCGGIFIAFCQYGDLWRRLRRAGHEGLNIRTAENYQPLQTKEALTLVLGMIRDPDAWLDHFSRSAASTVLAAIYAQPPLKSQKDPLVTGVLEFVHRLDRAALPGAHLVETFPIMRWIPASIAKWKRDAIEWHQKDTELFEGLLDDVSKTMVHGDCQPSFASSLLERKDLHGLSHKESAWLAGTLFGAGAETTAATLSVFMLAMVLYPDVMHKAQREIDGVVGRDRLPTFADKPNLPYIQALIREVLRWRPVGPVGVPRRTAKEDWYKGFFIPKDAIIIPNIWAMNRDPEIYPDFDEFRPERFLAADGRTEVIPADTHGQGHVTYGFGRRICLGMHLANNALFIDIASLLWAANIEKAMDENGQYITPSRTECVDDGLNVRPSPFKCKVSARSNDINTIVQAALEGFA